MEKHKIDLVSIRLKKDGKLMSNLPITCPQDAVSLLGRYIAKFDREVFCAIFCDASGQPTCCAILSIGVVTSAYASPREVFKVAYLTNACRIIVLHNHPSGICKPSKEDIYMTEKLKQNCKIMDFDFMDHIIIGNEKSETFYSFEAEKEYHMPYKNIRCDPEFMRLYEIKDLDMVSEDFSFNDIKCR